MLNSSQLRKSQEKSSIRESKGNKFILKEKEEVANNVAGLVKEKPENIDTTELDFINTTVSKKGIEFNILEKIYKLNTENERYLFEGYNFHDINHIAGFGNQIFHFIDDNILILKENNIEYISNKVIFKNYTNSLEEVFKNYIEKIIFFSEKFSGSKDFKEGFPIILSYKYINEKYSIDEIVHFLILGGDDEVKKEKLINNLSNEDSEHIEFILEESKRIKETFDYVKNNEIISSELLVINEFSKIYSELLYEILEGISKVLIGTVKLIDKNDEEKINIIKYKIQSINFKIQELFGSLYGFFNINDILNYYIFRGDEIDINDNLEEVNFNQNIGRIFSNILLNIKEHAFGEDFNGEDKELNVNGYFNDNGEYIVEIIDNGRGMSSDELRNVFIIGETIKEEKEGHGVAMGINRDYIQDLGGDITAHSDGLGKGAKFVVTIPKNLIVDDKKLEN